MKKQEVRGCALTEGGVCAPKGFTANGICCGLARRQPAEGNLPASGDGLEKNDLAMIYAEKPCAAAAMYTTNKVQAAPVLVTKRHLENATAQAVIVNSVNANACTKDGVEKAERMCAAAARALHLAPEDVIVASTGVIGQVLPVELIEAAVPRLAAGLSPAGHEAAVQAIMTTDTHPKEVAVTFEAGGRLCTLGGMLKGSGMIHPHMATTLTFLTTDCAVEAPLLQKALQEIVALTLNRVSVDGDTSTNDMVCLLSNGEAGNPKITEEGEDYQAFCRALYAVLVNLARMMARDGEGATKLLTCRCEGAKSDQDAETIARAVITSNLFKAAMFGEDANCGRILCAIGYAPAEVDIAKVDVTLASASGELPVCQGGLALNFSEEKAKEILREEEIEVRITAGDGDGHATLWGCDLTYEYVRINGDYRS